MPYIDIYSFVCYICCAQARLLSAEYKALSPSERAVWEQASTGDRARYNKEMLSYLPPAPVSNDGNGSDTSDVEDAAATIEAKKMPANDSEDESDEEAVIEGLEPKKKKKKKGSCHYSLEYDVQCLPCL